MFLLRPIIFITIFSLTQLSALTIQESVKEASQNNPDIFQAITQQQNAKEAVNKLQSDNYPTFFANGKLVTSKVKSRTTNYNSESVNSFDYSLGLKQNIYNGGATDNKIEYQNSKYFQQQKEVKYAYEDITYNVLVAYYNIIKNKKLVFIEKNNINVINKLFNEISQSHKSGYAVLSDVKKVEASLENAKYNYLVQKNQLDRWIATLEYYTLKDVNEKEIYEQDIQIILQKTLQEAIEEAQNSNPKIQALIKAIAAQTFYHKSTKATNLPTLDVVLEHGKSGDHDSLIGDTTQTQLYLDLNYKFAIGGAEKSKQKQAAIELKRLQHQLSSLRNKIKLDVTNIWEKTASLIKQIEHLEYYFIHTSSTIDLYKQEFDVGSRGLIDLLSAQEEYVTSEKNLVTARYDIKLLNFEQMYLSGNVMKPVMNSKVVTKSDSYKEYMFSQSYYNKLMDPQNKNKYIIHLAVYKYEKHMNKLLDKNRIRNNTYGFVIDNTNLTKIVFGIFDSHKAAQKHLSKYIKRKDVSDNKPYITRASVVQKMIKKAKGLEY